MTYLWNFSYGIMKFSDNQLIIHTAYTCFSHLKLQLPKLPHFLLIHAEEQVHVDYLDCLSVEDVFSLKHKRRLFNFQDITLMFQEFVTQFYCSMLICCFNNVCVIILPAMRSVCGKFISGQLPNYRPNFSETVHTAYL